MIGFILYPKLNWIEINLKWLHGSFRIFNALTLLEICCGDNCSYDISDDKGYERGSSFGFWFRVVQGLGLGLGLSLTLAFVTRANVIGKRGISWALKYKIIKCVIISQESETLSRVLPNGGGFPRWNSPFLMSGFIQAMSVSTASLPSSASRKRLDVKSSIFGSVEDLNEISSPNGFWH